MRRTPSHWLLVAVLPVAGLVAGCSDDESASTDDTGSPTSEAAAPDDSATTSTTEAAFTSERYADPASWACRPDLADDPCTSGLDLTVLQEDGSTEVVPFQPASDPPIDCFYIYPTVNISAEGVAGFDGDYGIEIGITRTQAGRFSSVCRVLAPLYEQSTFGAGDDVDTDAIREQAFADVDEAFQQYLANDNDGRPFVIMGHSQGSFLGTRLIQERIETDESLRSQLVSALLLGAVITAPEGADVGGTFQEVPVCRDDAQTGCVVTYASFDVTDPPEPGQGFGSPREDQEGVALCTNPAALDGGPATLQMIDPTGNEPETELGVAIDTPYVALPDFVSGECISGDGVVYLGITVNAGDGPRTDVLRSDTSLPWGLHPIDYNLALGDLVDLVAAQSAAFTGSE